MKLYYYTNDEFLRENLQKRRVKLSRYRQLNDPFEQSAYDTSDPKLRKKHKTSANYFAQHVGLICLSETRKSPPMWAHYTRNHEGACLEFDVTYDHVIKVKYQRKKLFPGMTLKTLPDNVNSNNYNAILGTKSEDWSYEKEHRLHITLENKIVIREGENYFMPFRVKTDNTFMLKRIFIGYRCSLGIENIRHDVKDYHHKVKVIQTRPAFKSFEVIEQQEKLFWNMKEGEKGKEYLLPSVKAAFGD